MECGSEEVARLLGQLAAPVMQVPRALGAHAPAYKGRQPAAMHTGLPGLGLEAALVSLHTLA